MNFKISDGLGQISLFEDEMGGYVEYENTPLAVFWSNEDDYDYDEESKYCNTLKYCEAYRKKIATLVNFDLNKDFARNKKSAYKLLNPLLRLLENGDYSLSISNHTKKIKLPKYPINPSGWEMIITTPPRPSEDHSLTCYEDTPLDTDSFYNYDDNVSFIATVPFETIDEDRVQYFELQLEKGERPFAIVLRYFNFDDESRFYILDGHCKLRAYSRQKIMPHIVFITQQKKQVTTEKHFDIERFIDLLYPYEIRSILSGDLYKGSFIHELAKKTGSKLHRFIKNGDHELYYPNRQIKSRAFYVDDKPEGIFKEWYDNGQLKYEYEYKDGKSIGDSKVYTKSGILLQFDSFNEQGQYHGSSRTFYENGHKKSETFYENGQPVRTARHWYLNGQYQYQYQYRDGKFIEKKEWHHWGELAGHLVFNDSKNKWIKIKPKLWKTSDYYILFLYFIFLVVIGVIIWIAIVN